MAADRSAAFFDFNGTLVTGEVWEAMRSWKRRRDEWRKRERLLIARQIPIVMASRVGLVSTDFMVRRWMRAAWSTMRGIDAAELADLVADAWERTFRPSIRDGVAGMVRERRDDGHLLVLVSGTYEPFLGPVQQELGFDAVIGTRVEVEGGRITGRVVGEVVTGVEKVNLVMTLIRGSSPPIDLGRSLAYADTERDLDLLELVGNPVAVWPNRRLERIAQRQSWPVVGGSGST